MSHIEITRGNCPVILGMPHTGVEIPEDILTSLNATGHEMSDTDWNIDKLFDGLLADVTAVRTRVHRYVIDVNRDPAGHSLYPGQNTTGLCATTDFDGVPIYLEGQEPDQNEIDRRTKLYHQPYHAALESELDRLRKQFGFVILFDCHSIRSNIPFLFAGKLPDFNIGTNSGTTCDPQIEAAVVDTCAGADGYTHVLNGRFKGGWTTRHYGDLDQGVHTVQLELAQSTYMLESQPWTYQVQKAEELRNHLRQMLETLSNWRPK